MSVTAVRPARSGPRHDAAPARVAVVGSGIAGLAAARELQSQAQVTLFEAGDHFGGHAHTVDVTLNGITHGVDTGFLVFNHRTYPGLVQLFDELEVPTVASDMSFSVQHRTAGLEWSGRDLGGLFAQPRNALRPSFWRMLAQILRFNRLATRLAKGDDAQALAEPLGQFLDRHGFDAGFRDGYFLPMTACIWSCPTTQMLQFPVGTLIRFCHNHGLIQLRDRPQWHTVAGGSREYVRRLVAQLDDARLATPVRSVRRIPAGGGEAGVAIATDAGVERFDAVLMACHSDQALALLADARDDERATLGAIGYHANEAVLHTDASLLPRARRAWSAWNYERGDDRREAGGVCLHYLIHQLQPVPWSTPVIVSLNPVREPDPAKVLLRQRVMHPVFDLAAVRAQARLPSVQGRARVWFAGAWTGYGFHEDGLRSGQDAARSLGRWLHAIRAAELAA